LKQRNCKSAESEMVLFPIPYGGRKPAKASE
jgi:hypothetical protein